MLTEQERVRYDKRMVDDVLYSGEDWELALAMIKSLRMEARRDPFLAQVLAKAETQQFMVNKKTGLSIWEFQYTLDTRCKWDWWLPTFGFGGDLKTTFAQSQKNSSTKLWTSSIGTVLVPGTWISPEAGKISFTGSLKEPKDI